MNAPGENAASAEELRRCREELHEKHEAFLRLQQALSEQAEERRRAEQALERKEEQYRLLTENLPVGIVETTPEGKILYHNTCFLEILGYPSESPDGNGMEGDFRVHPRTFEVMGYRSEGMTSRDLGEFFAHAEDWEAVRDNLVTHGSHRFECTFSGKDGRRPWVRGTVRVLWNLDGEQIHLYFLEDVTEQKRMERELIHLEKTRALGELARAISHNLNNLLTTILTPAEIIKEITDDDNVLHWVDFILSSSRRAVELVRRFNQGAHRPSGEKLKPVDLDQAIREVVKATRPCWKDQPESKGLKISVTTDLGEVPSIKGAASELDDLLVNLIFNAVDAMPEGGILTLRTREVEGKIRLEVSDTGVGMDEEVQKRIFEPFFTTKDDVGSGLGLYTVYGTVEKWGGRIDVHSTPGKGTTFVIDFLPWEDEKEERPSDPGQPARHSRLRVLIVEDDATVGLTLSGYLSQQYEVRLFKTGDEAVDAFSPGRWDVALIDLGLPGLPGDQVARRLHQQDPALATVLLTGWDIDFEDPRAAPFDLCAHKPIHLTELDELVKRAAEIHAQRMDE